MGLEEIIREKLFSMLAEQKVVPYSDKPYPVLKEFIDKHIEELKAKNGT